MEYQLSKPLTVLLDSPRSERGLNLPDLANNLISLFEGRKATAACLLAKVNGEMLPGTLCRILFDCIVHDSVVRDILTTGHLAKLLSRWDVFKRTEDPRIVGLPNPVFDERSQIERAEYFRSGGILPIDATVLESEDVKDLLRREEN